MAPQMHEALGPDHEMHLDSGSGVCEIRFRVSAQEHMVCVVWVQLV